MIYIGIDPGKKGAIGSHRGWSRCRWSSACAAKAVTSSTWRDCETSSRQTPRASVASHSRGVIEGLLVALRIPYQLVAPQAWQRVMHQGAPEGDTKVRSILAAERLFPDLSLLRSAGSRKPDDGFAEAALLAEFARRTHQGREPR